MQNHYDKSKPLHDLEGWIVFYGQQAMRLEDDTAMAQVFQASCETCELLLELQEFRKSRERLLWKEIERQSNLPSPLTGPLEITDETNRPLGCKETK